MKSALIKSLHTISSRLEYSLTAEEFSRRIGVLQGLDARVKLVTVLLLIITVSIVHSPWILLGYYLLMFGLALISDIPAGYFITRVWLPLPLLTALVAVPALFLTPGQTFIILPAGLAITDNGAISFVTLFLRVGTSISLTLLFVLTTSWASLLRALTVLRLPQVIVLLVGMTYRYIYVLLNLANDMLLARYSRTVGRLGSSDERATEGAILGTLLSRSLDMSGEVYLAMQSRGFRGYAHIMKTGKMGRMDYLWIVMVLGVILTSLIVAGLIP
ncbi:MAG: cobalt ECF transporter T component CbiQ [Anaerolineae bacterium]